MTYEKRESIQHQLQGERNVKKNGLLRHLHLSLRCRVEVPARGRWVVARKKPQKWPNKYELAGREKE